MTNILIVEPNFTLFPICTKDNYLQHLELCGRVSYKSEDKITNDSAEKFLSKVAKKLGHESILEHSHTLIKITNPYIADDLFKELVLAVPLLALHISFRDSDDKDYCMLVSGNLRMWLEWARQYPPPGQAKCAIGHGIEYCLQQQWPFFFESVNRPHTDISLVDDQFLLTKEEKLKHLTRTGRFIGSRTMSHQLVRTRLAAFTQESMRFINYGQKGYQYIIPLLVDNHPESLEDYNFIMNYSYNRYLEMLEAGILPEDARFILSNASKTEVIMTMTLGMWQHTIKQRINLKAQWEIRGLYLEAEKQLKEVYPEIF